MMKVGQSNKCGCGRSLDPEGRCDSSHALTEDQYQEMLERVERRKKENIIRSHYNYDTVDSEGGETD
jgi:CDGSH-type Zn-finger protein